MIASTLFGVLFAFQGVQPSPTRAPTDSSATAVRAGEAPVIDARDTDKVWSLAPAITAFQQWRPNEGKPPRFKTAAKVAYDESNLYVFIRAYDPHPDSIKVLLERRDSFTSSDMFWVFIDSYHDRRTGYEFGVNADTPAFINVASDRFLDYKGVGIARGRQIQLRLKFIF